MSKTETSRGRGPVLVSGAVVLGVAIQVASSEATFARMCGRALPSQTDLGPLWTPYCTPSKAVLLRAASWPDFAGWIFENAGDLLTVALAIVALQLWLGSPRPRLGPALRLVGGELGLGSGALVALAAAVLLFDLPFLVSPRNVVLWEIANDVGWLTSSLLVGHVVWRCAPRYWGSVLSRPRMDVLFAASAALLSAVLIGGGFATAWLQQTWGAVGPRWPLIVFAVCLQGWLLSHGRPGAPSAPRETPMRQKLALALAALTLMLVISEVAARVFLIRGGYDTVAEENAPGESETPTDDLENPQGAIELSRLVRASANPRRVYELRPNQRDTIEVPSLSSTDFVTNSFGMRGPETSIDKPPGTIRIAGLGDSVMFGWGVAYRETQLAVLGELLQQRDPSHRYETLNFGVPGYNTVMERESFTALASRFSPDLVLLTVVSNDADLPNFLQRPRNPLCLHRSFFSGLLRRVVSGTDPYSTHEILVAQSYDFERGHFKTADGRTPVGSEGFSGTENATEALRRLHQDVRAAGAELVVTFDYGDLDADLDQAPPGEPDVRDAILDAAQELGITMIDPRDALVAYLRENQLRSADLWVGPTDSHPNATRHRLTAEVLANELAGALE